MAIVELQEFLKRYPRVTRKGHDNIHDIHNTRQHAYIAEKFQFQFLVNSIFRWLEAVFINVSDSDQTLLMLLTLCQCTRLVSHLYDDLDNYSYGKPSV